MEYLNVADPTRSVKMINYSTISSALKNSVNSIFFFKCSCKMTKNNVIFHSKVFSFIGSSIVSAGK